MKIETITKFEDFLSLETIWNNLVEKSENDTLFLRHEWFKCWWLGFGKNKQLFVLLVKDEGSIIGIAPLMIERTHYRGFPVRKIEFIENSNSPRVNFILTKKKEECLEAVFNYLKENKDKWDIIDLRNVPEDTFICGSLPEVLDRNKLLSGIRKGLHSPFISVNSDWHTYYSTRTRRFRKSLKNKTNRIKKIGEPVIQKFENIGNPGTVLTDIMEISKNSWKGKYQRDIASIEDNRRFFEELSKEAGKKRWLNIWLLSINGKPVAYEYHLKYKDRVSALRGDFDERLRDYSPGSILDAYIVRHVFESNLKEYDMGGSNDFYKRNWTSSARRHTEFIAYKNDLIWRLLYFLEFRVIFFLKKSDILMKLKKSLYGASRG